jgi:hypothetical protein
MNASGIKYRNYQYYAITGGYILSKRWTCAAASVVSSLDMTFTFRTRLLLLLPFCAALPMSVGVAKADITPCDFTSQLNTPDAALLQYLPSSGAFGTVCVNLDATKTKATITFTAAPGFEFEQFLLDVVPNGLGYAGETGGFHNLALGAFSSVGPFDIFGKFDTYLSQPLIATTETIYERGTFADASSVLGANNLGYDAAAFVWVCGTSINCSSPS